MHLRIRGLFSVQGGTEVECYLASGIQLNDCGGGECNPSRDGFLNFVFCLEIAPIKATHCLDNQGNHQGNI